MTVYRKEPMYVPVGAECNENFSTKKIGSLRVVGYYGSNKWVVKCDCGMFEVRSTKGLKKAQEKQEKTFCAICQGYPDTKIQDRPTKSILTSSIIDQKIEAEAYLKANNRLESEIRRLSQKVSDMNKEMLDLFHCLQIPKITGGEMMKVSGKLKALGLRRRASKDQLKEIDFLKDNLGLSSSALMTKMNKYTEQCEESNQIGIQHYRDLIGSL